MRNEMRMPKVRQELDLQRCDNPMCPGGHPIFVVAHCHPGGGIDAGYDKSSGCMNLYCHVCKEPVYRVQVAEVEVQ